MLNEITKQNFNIVYLISIAGGSLLELLGGYDISLQTLIICMVIDFLTGVLGSLVFHTSTKTKDGGLSTNEMFKGLMRKIFMIITIVLCVAIDNYLSINYLRNVVIVGFIINEVSSVFETLSRCGIANDTITNVFDKMSNFLEEKKGE